MPIKINIYNQKAEVIGEKELSSKVFGVKINPSLVHQAVVAQQANHRQVLAHTKDRGEVRGGGKKPWRQKGTGRARHGSSRSPIWIGGGITFGPTKDRNFKKNINKKMRQKAILMVLSDKVENKNLLIVDRLEVEGYKTKIFKEIIDNLEKNIFNINQDKKNKILKRSLLIVVDKLEEKLKYSARNLADLKLINFVNINIVDLLKYKNLVILKDSVEKLEKIYQ